MGTEQSDSGSMGFWGAAAIGVGGMVGGGIFAVLGLAVELAAGGAPVAFAIAGLVAFLTAYSYARLSLAFPSQGGTVEFLVQGLGKGLLSGSLNVLLWISYIVMLSLYAYAFGSYGASLFSDGEQPLLKHLLASAVVVLFSVLNVIGSRAVGRAETLIVGVKVAILLVFVGVGLWSVEPGRLDPSEWSGPLPLLAGGMMIFLAYEGFELIANTAGDVRNPSKTLPRAFFGSVGFVIVLYVTIALVTVGNLPIPQIVDARDYALARAAEPFFGSFGFGLIAVAAMLSTASAINATLYGSARVSYVIAKDGELPEVLEHKIWRRPVEGLLITTGAALLLVNVGNLSSIATMGSAGFLLVFAAVNVAHARTVDKTGGSRALASVAASACLVALVALTVETAQRDPAHLWILLGMIVVAVAVEGIYRVFVRVETGK